MRSSVKLHQCSESLRGRSHRGGDAEYSDDTSYLSQLKFSHTALLIRLRAGQSVRVFVFFFMRDPFARRRCGVSANQERTETGLETGSTTRSECAELLANPARCQREETCAPRSAKNDSGLLSAHGLVPAMTYAAIMWGQPPRLSSRAKRGASASKFAPEKSALPYRGRAALQRRVSVPQRPS